MSAARGESEHDEVRRLSREIMNTVDASIAETDPQFMMASVLIASMRAGADEAKITRLLDYDAEFVAQVGSRLRNAGIWRGDELSREHIDAWWTSSGSIAFLMDLNVAAGLMQVTRSDKGQPMYAITPAGERWADGLIRGTKKKRQP